MSSQLKIKKRSKYLVAVFQNKQKHLTPSGFIYHGPSLSAPTIGVNIGLRSSPKFLKSWWAGSIRFDQPAHIFLYIKKWTQNRLHSYGVILRSFAVFLMTEILNLYFNCGESGALITAYIHGARAAASWKKFLCSLCCAQHHAPEQILTEAFTVTELEAADSIEAAVRPVVGAWEVLDCNRLFFFEYNASTHGKPGFKENRNLLHSSRLVFKIQVLKIELLTKCIPTGRCLGVLHHKYCPT